VNLYSLPVSSSRPTVSAFVCCLLVISFSIINSLSCSLACAQKRRPLERVDPSHVRLLSGFLSVFQGLLDTAITAVGRCNIETKEASV